MYINHEGVITSANESIVSYNVDTNKGYLYQLIGEKATDMLYEKLYSYHNIIFSDEDSLRFAGLSEKQISTLIAARNLHNGNFVEGITSSMDVYKKYSYLRFYNEEHFYILCVNRNNKIISDFLLSKGGVGATIVDTKILFRKALVVPRLSGIVMIHNHPSGNTDPSSHDKDITNKVKSACGLLDITLLDHVIVGGEKYYSFADSGSL